MLKTWIIIILFFNAVALVSMGLAWVLRARTWYFLSLASCLGGALVGNLLTQATASFATSVDPAKAGLKGALIGFGIGSVCAGFWMGIFYLIKSKRKEPPGKKKR